MITRRNVYLSKFNVLLQQGFGSACISTTINCSLIAVVGIRIDGKEESWLLMKFSDGIIWAWEGTRFPDVGVKPTVVNKDISIGSLSLIETPVFFEQTTDFCCSGICAGGFGCRIAFQPNVSDSFFSIGIKRYWQCGLIAGPVTGHKNLYNWHFRQQKYVAQWTKKVYCVAQRNKRCYFFHMLRVLVIAD